MQSQDTGTKSALIIRTGTKILAEVSEREASQAGGKQVQKTSPTCCFPPHQGNAKVHSLFSWEVFSGKTKQNKTKQNQLDFPFCFTGGNSSGVPVSSQVSLVQSVHQDTALALTLMPSTRPGAVTSLSDPACHCVTSQLPSRHVCSFTLSQKFGTGRVRTNNTDI